MAPSEVSGYAGAVLAGAAYVPQIHHMVSERCTAGVSPPAFAVWLVASVLITVRAIATDATVFMVLGGVQTLATGFILGYVGLHAGCFCGRHAQHA